MVYARSVQCQKLNLTIVKRKKDNRNSRKGLLANSELNIGLIVSGTFRDESASVPLLLILPKVFSNIPLLDKPSLPLSSRSPNDTNKCSPISQPLFKLEP